MDESEFANIIRKAGGRAFIVGGWVRDQLRGIMPHDKDFVVSGVETENFEVLFPTAMKVGRSFPVYLLTLSGKKSEVALARTERKCGHGYTGFEVKANKDVTIEEDLFRRDTTMNAIAMELPEKVIIDPYGGMTAIQEKKIQAVSKHFLEDPVRSLRAARQAATFGFSITSETRELMQQTRAELELEPTERVIGELQMALTAEKPSVFFRELKQAQLLSTVFPAIAALAGKTQPKEFHPEGDAFEHSLDILDRVAMTVQDVAVRFAALVHDLGKGTTPKEMEPHHYGHEERGIIELDKWNERMLLPKIWRQTAEFVIKEHMRAPRLEKWGKIVDLLLGLNRLPVRATDVLAIFAADHHGLPDYLLEYTENLNLILEVRGKDAPESLDGPAVGEWIRSEQIRRLKRKYC